MQKTGCFMQKDVSLRTRSASSHVHRICVFFWKVLHGFLATLLQTRHNRFCTVCVTLRRDLRFWHFRGVDRSDRAVSRGTCTNARPENTRGRAAVTLVPSRRAPFSYFHVHMDSPFLTFTFFFPPLWINFPITYFGFFLGTAPTEAVQLQQQTRQGFDLENGPEQVGTKNTKRKILVKAKVTGWRVAASRTCRRAPRALSVGGLRLENC